MYVKLTERERLAMENKLLREMAGRYARLIENSEKTANARSTEITNRRLS